MLHQEIQKIHLSEGTSAKRGREQGAAQKGEKGLKTWHAKGSLHKIPRLLFSVTLQNFTSEAETKGKTNQKDTDATRGMGRVGEKEGWGLCSLLNLV